MASLGSLYDHRQGVLQNHERAYELYQQSIRTECPLLGKRTLVTGTSRGDVNGCAGVASWRPTLTTIVIDT